MLFLIHIPIFFSKCQQHINSDRIQAANSFAIQTAPSPASFFPGQWIHKLPNLSLIAVFIFFKIVRDQSQIFSYRQKISSKLTNKNVSPLAVIDSSSSHYVNRGCHNCCPGSNDAYYSLPRFRIFFPLPRVL
jgi:hypothetical protein